MVKIVDIDSHFVEDPREYFHHQSHEATARSGALPMTFTPIKFRDVELKNRIVVSPMCMYSSQDGFSTDWHIAHYGGLAMKQPGAVIVEATNVQANGRISINCLGIYKDEHVEGLSRVARIIKMHGVVPGIQLGHAGRKASTLPLWRGRDEVASEASGGWPNNVKAPSAIPFNADNADPIELTKDEILELVEDFGKAAARADKAGFEIAEIHAAHGYILSEFLSPSSNKRTDEYGGSFENRIRLLLQVVDSMKKNWPSGKSIWVRISCTEWVEGGWTIEDSVELSKRLKDLGVDLVDCSSGGITASQKIGYKPLFQVPFAEQIRTEAGISTGAVGFITQPREVEDILSSGKADVVLLARKFLSEPTFVLRAASELGVDLPWIYQHNRGK
ncbi:NADPH dehydrogenase [Zancudomyces culisetae]|uniref:NADPH dehydrogenase n=1 Tax=Zancudomyces culisetae TaxID=1213189 RepID=A0A1R1PRQ6_ZANCU|nr:NADPH dehydrogenase [Zancudomyces culisetae]|eukprot:OMH83631.1 NADPH dehydrogenase [Zancudomyces culisetae]